MKTLTPAQHKALEVIPDEWGIPSVSRIHNGVLMRLIAMELIEWKRPEWMLAEVDPTHNRHAVWRLNWGTFRRTDKGREQLTYETPCPSCGAVADTYHQAWCTQVQP
jgi:hypothetical protein